MALRARHPGRKSRSDWRAGTQQIHLDTAGLDVSFKVRAAGSRICALFECSVRDDDTFGKSGRSGSGPAVGTPPRCGRFGQVEPGGQQPLLPTSTNHAICDPVANAGGAPIVLWSERFREAWPQTWRHPGGRAMVSDGRSHLPTRPCDFHRGNERCEQLSSSRGCNREGKRRPLF